MMFSASRMLRSHLLLGDSADTTPTTVLRGSLYLSLNATANLVSIVVPNRTLLSINRRCLHVHCEDVFDVHGGCVAHVFIIGGHCHPDDSSGTVSTLSHSPASMKHANTRSHNSSSTCSGRSLTSRQQQSVSCSCSRRKTSWVSFMGLFAMDTV